MKDWEIFEENWLCASLIDAKIDEFFDGFRFNAAKAVNAVAAEFEPEAILRTLAVTVRGKDWDERFTLSNRRWAGEFPVPNCLAGRNPKRICETHSGLLDRFVTEARKQLEEVR